MIIYDYILSRLRLGGSGADGTGMLVDNLVFLENFTGNGTNTIFQLTGAIQNGTFSVGAWDVNRVKYLLPANIAGVSSKKPIYDAGILFVLTRNRINVSNVSSTGAVTLDFPPQSGENFFIAYWYFLKPEDIILSYVREDFVVSMESDLSDINERINLKLDKNDPDFTSNTSQRITTIFSSVNPTPSDNSYIVGRTRWLNTSDDMLFYLLKITGTIAKWVARNEFDLIDFTTTTRPSYKKGRVWYDPETNCINLYNDKNQITWQLGREFLLEVKNTTGSIIPNGVPIYITGADSGIPTVGLADASSFLTAAVVGISTMSIPIDSTGEVTITGAINDIDTSMFTVGDILYLSEIPGGYTTKPPPISVIVGQVGISDAVNGRIYIFPPRLPSRTNRIRVRSLFDLPDPVANIITLEEDIIYEIVGTVDIEDNTLKLLDRTALIGYSNLDDKIIYTGTGDMFISVDSDLLIQGLELKADNGRICYFKNIAGNEKTKHAYINDVRIINCNNLGKFENLKIVKIVGIELINAGSGGMLIDGASCGDFLFLDSIINSFTGTLFDFGTSVSDVVHIDRCEIHVPSGSIGLDGLINNGNLSSPSGNGKVTNNNFLNSGVFFQNIDDGGTRWDFIGNGSVDDITDNIATGFISMEDNVAITDIVTQNVWVKIAGTTIAGSNNLRFSMSMDNRLRYDGESNYKGNITVTGSADITAGTNIYEASVFKNGAKIANVKLAFQVVNGKPNGFALTAPINALTNDYFEVFIRCTDSNKDVTVVDLHMSIG